mmetsp:Transcript_52726/g.113890  ORF Transcript_52726/g.113890 Transcript_52726/m.113890 type:complete len:300 (+) Transcript_52726:225-1124(+)
MERASQAQIRSTAASMPPRRCKATRRLRSLSMQASSGESAPSKSRLREARRLQCSANVSTPREVTWQAKSDTEESCSQHSASIMTPSSVTPRHPDRSTWRSCAQCLASIETPLSCTPSQPESVTDMICPHRRAKATTPSSLTERHPDRSRAFKSWQQFAIARSPSSVTSRQLDTPKVSNMGHPSANAIRLASLTRHRNSWTTWSWLARLDKAVMPLSVTPPQPERSTRRSRRQCSANANTATSVTRRQLDRLREVSSEAAEARATTPSSVTLWQAERSKEVSVFESPCERASTPASVTL